MSLKGMMGDAQRVVGSRKFGKEMNEHFGNFSVVLNFQA